jgi:hypothetical protein
MKTLACTIPEAEIAQTFPRLFSYKVTADIAVFASVFNGTWLTGDKIGAAFQITVNVYDHANWKLLPIGHSVTLIQE